MTKEAEQVYKYIKENCGTIEEVDSYVRSEKGPIYSREDELEEKLKNEYLSFVGTPMQIKDKREDIKKQYREKKNEIHHIANSLDDAIELWIKDEINDDNFYSDNAWNLIYSYVYNQAKGNGWCDFYYTFEELDELVRNIFKEKGDK